MLRRHMQTLLRQQTPLQRRQCKGLRRASPQALESLRLQSQTAKLMQLAAISALSRAKLLTAVLEPLSRCGCLLHNLDVDGPAEVLARTQCDTMASGLSSRHQAAVLVVAKRMLKCCPLAQCCRFLSCLLPRGCK